MRFRPSSGVFWVTDEGLLACPFYEGAYVGVAKSGATFNHKELWDALMGTKGKPFDYFPRGRVEAKKQGNAIVYLSPHIDVETYLPEIRKEFGIEGKEIVIRQDYSVHYRCHLDAG